jgi:hypothetical protein
MVFAIKGLAERPSAKNSLVCKAARLGWSRIFMVQPVVTPGKQVTVNAQSMLSNAEKVSAVGFAGANRVIITLPLEASARITEPSKVVIAAPMTSSVLFSPNYAINTTATDQVVLYVLHEDPILYLREDIIK